MYLFHWLLSVTVVIWIYWLWSRRRFYAMIFKIPGYLGFPLLGIAPYLMRIEEVLTLFHKNTEIFGSFAFTWLGPYPILIVSDPNIAQDVFTSPDCVNKSIVYKASEDAIGKSLESLNDPEWSLHRKHLNQSFSHKVLLNMLPIFNDEVKSLLKMLENLESVDVSTFTDLTLNIATRTIMGASAAQGDHESKKNLLKSFYFAKDSVIAMIFSPWLRIKLLRKLIGMSEPYEKAKAKVRQFIRELIEQHLSTGYLRSHTPGQKQVFINTAIELMRQGVFSQQDVEDESHIMVFGAFETTANTIYYALMLLAMFPEYQEKVFEELLTIFPDVGDIDVSYSNIQDLVYMDMVLNESMRVLTPVPIVARETSNDVKLSNGVIVPAGVQVAIFIHGIHRSEEVWGSDAHLFNPDHFQPSNMVGKHPYAFIPFTKGIRNCIGWRYGLLSSKITLAKLLRNYKFSTDFLYKDLELVEEIVLKLKHVPLLNIEKRNI